MRLVEEMLLSTQDSVSDIVVRMIFSIFVDPVTPLKKVSMNTN